MNDDQRAVLAAIARMEGRPGTLIDEYTVARDAGILTTDLAGHEYVASPGRETVRRHFAALEEAGLIATAKDGRVRSCAIVPEALAPVRSWLDEQRAIWEARLDRLDDYVTKLMKERAK